jgi:serine/threonine protein kinase
MMFSMRYAAPETMIAREAGEATVVADAAVDMWALGIMAFELLTDEPIFQSNRDSEQDIMDRLTGRAALPWEEGWHDGEETTRKLRQLRMLRRSLLQCLSRDPRARPTSDELLAIWDRMFDYDDAAGPGRLSGRRTGDQVDA